MRSRPPIELRSGVVIVRFDWIGDRYRHEIWIGDAVVARSIEGDGRADVPPSPPLQDLSLENLGGGLVAIMGVGGAGRGHWSISVTAETGITPDTGIPPDTGITSTKDAATQPDVATQPVVATQPGGGLLFELACRGDVPDLGSRYEILGDVSLVPRPTAIIAGDDAVVDVRPVERLVGTSVWSYAIRG